MEQSQTLRALTDMDLVSEIERLAGCERSAIASLVAALGEFDSRRLYLPLGYSCLFNYCTDALHLSEDAAFNRIEVARASRKFPQLLSALDDGSLSLTNIRLLAPHLTQLNVEHTIRAARHARKDAVKLLVARLHPEPPVSSVVRKLPEINVTAARDISAAPVLSRQPEPASRRPVIAPLSETHYKLQVTISAQSRDRLRRIQDLMRHVAPSGDPAIIVERALEMLEADLLKKKAGVVSKPREARAPVPKGRHIPPSVKREVWARDEGRCGFTADNGRRCDERGSLEYHHVVPFVDGGATTAGNIQLRCRSHNGLEWQTHVEQAFALMGE